MKPRTSSPISTSPGIAKVRVQREGAIATVVLSNPAKLNVLNTAMWREVKQVFEDLSREDSLRCVVVRGEGGNFAAGADISEFPTERLGFDRVYRYHQEVVAPALHAVAECQHPIVALIEGVCVGGGLEIASQCDLRIAGKSARFGLPINRLGFPAAPEEFRALLGFAGRKVTLEILLEGAILNARQALQKGLLTRVVPDREVAKEAFACAGRICQGAPLAARLNKQLIRRLVPSAPALSKAELRAFFLIWAESDDHREGVSAFLEKRTPRFNGKPAPRRQRA